MRISWEWLGGSLSYDRLAVTVGDLTRRSM